MVNFSIGGFYLKSKELYFIIEVLAQNNFKWLKDNYAITSVYGSFPNAIWSGGRSTIGFPWSMAKISKTIEYYNSKNIGINFTFTNPLIENKHLNDYYCNTLLEMANNEKNSIIINSDLLYEYIKKLNLKYKTIFSITRGIDNIEELKSYIKKFDFVVPPTNLLNQNDELFKQIDSSKLEMLVNEVCVVPDCKYKTKHYEIEAIRNMQLDKNIQQGFCSNKFKKKNINKYENHLSSETISFYNKKYNISNFKFSGRAQPSGRFFEEFCRFLIKDEYKINFYNNVLYYYDMQDNIVEFETPILCLENNEPK